jgi:hypothetical protein
MIGVEEMDEIAQIAQGRPELLSGDYVSFSELI